MNVTFRTPAAQFKLLPDCLCFLELIITGQNYPVLPGKSTARCIKILHTTGRFIPGLVLAAA